MALLRDLSNEDWNEWFPRLQKSGYRITSPATDEYNCIAWAAADASEKWDPSRVFGRYWPDNIRQDFSLQSFIDLYHLEGGYSPCENGEVETGFEKIAIFVGANKEVEHAARQLPSGLWTSKLGDFEDIQHSLQSLEGGRYGFVKQFLKRPTPKA